MPLDAETELFSAAAFHGSDAQLFATSRDRRIGWPSGRVGAMGRLDRHAWLITTLRPGVALLYGVLGCALVLASTGLLVRDLTRVPVDSTAWQAAIGIVAGLGFAIQGISSFRWLREQRASTQRAVRGTDPAVQADNAVRQPPQ